MKMPQNAILEICPLFPEQMHVLSVQSILDDWSITSDTFFFSYLKYSKMPK